jgi:glycosyltransferase involved in cell wall biosynthesis
MTEERPPRVTVVVPVYNEMATIEEILCRVQAVNLDMEIVVVDDGSTDGTREFLAGLVESVSPVRAPLTRSRSETALRSGAIRVLLQGRNRGKGAALRRGFQEAKGDIVIVQDADLEYDPRDYQKLIEPIDDGQADVVYGSRFLGGPHRVLFFWHYVGNKFLTTLSDMVTNLNLSDVWTCYKAFKREVVQSIDLCEDRFGFEQEITIKIAQAGWRVYETPISYYGRTYAEGKKITWRDGLRALWCLLRYGVTSGPRVQPKSGRVTGARRDS